MAEVPADPVKARHICDVAAGVVSRPALSESDRIDLAESIDLTRRMEACPDRSTEGCGCGGAKCARNGGGRVNHRDCFQCLTLSPVISH